MTRVPALLGTRRRFVLVAVVMALGIGLVAGLALPACYDVPQPACGFRCGPSAECPDDYTCNNADGRCHLNGTPDDMVCGVELDAAIDAPDDAPPDAEIDAAIDAPPDAAIDGAIDAAIDAPPPDAAIDAAIDASIDAAIDAP